MAHQPVWLVWLVVFGMLELVSGDWLGRKIGDLPTLERSLQVKQKRQVEVDLAFNRLRVLESLDGQLRHWTAEVAASDFSSERVCRLPVDVATKEATSYNHNGQKLPPDTCPEDQVPPYMLNLQRMIIGQASSQADTVRLMPYGSLVARSFRQPAPSWPQQEMKGWKKEAQQQPPPPLGWSGNAGSPPNSVEQQQQLVVELSVATNTSLAEEEEPWTHGTRQPAAGHHPPTPRTCNRFQQLCYWFPLNRNLAKRINGSLGGTRERLLEAELHLYKLAPKLLLVSPSTPRLKTDLLEVSLYQILARGAPARLLDIRRIDLHSVGWETFYVKRALQDWLREPALNLGLVIKAKSMFKEPIGDGLVRFANWPSKKLSQNERQLRELSSAMEHTTTSKTTTTSPEEESSEFNLSHQPILVIYTTIEQSQPS